MPFTSEYLTQDEVNHIVANKHNNYSQPPSPSLSPLSADNPIELSVIVPCYNETERLHLLLEDAIPVLNSMYPLSTPQNPNSKTLRWEILLVDDGSVDGTAEYAIKWAAEQHQSGAQYLPPGTIRVCKLEKNRGKGGAVAHGMKHFRGKYAIFADADGASKFDDVRRLLRNIDLEVKRSYGSGNTNDSHEDINNKPNATTAVETSQSWKYPMVAIGSRAHMVKTDAVVNRSFIRNFLMYGLHTLVFIFGIRTIRDTQCGFKLFTRGAAFQIFPYIHTEGWIFDVEVLIIAMRKSIPIIEVPISWHEVEGSKVELARDSIKMAIDLVVMRLAFLLGVYSDGSKNTSYEVNEQQKTK